MSGPWHVLLKNHGSRASASEGTPSRSGRRVVVAVHGQPSGRWVALTRRIASSGLLLAFGCSSRSTRCRLRWFASWSGRRSCGARAVERQRVVCDEDDAAVQFRIHVSSAASKPEHAVVAAGRARCRGATPRGGRPRCAATRRRGRAEARASYARRGRARFVKRVRLVVASFCLFLKLIQILSSWARYPPVCTGLVAAKRWCLGTSPSPAVS